MEFVWNAQKAEANHGKHGVSFHEAATIFGDALSWTFPDEEHSTLERRWITIGVSETGRLITVVHSDQGQGSIRLISARRATRKERRFYEEGR